MPRTVRVAAIRNDTLYSLLVGFKTVRLNVLPAAATGCSLLVDRRIIVELCTLFLNNLLKF